MKKSLMDDAYAEALSNVSVATLPLITLGWLGNTYLLYISATVGLAAFLGFVIRICMITRGRTKDSSAGTVLRQCVSDLFFPYVFVLSSLILMHNGLDASIGLWFAAAFALLIIIACLMKPRSK